MSYVLPTGTCSLHAALAPCCLFHANAATISPLCSPQSRKARPLRAEILRMQPPRSRVCASQQNRISAYSYPQQGESMPAILKVTNFEDSQISRKMIHGGDGAVALPCCRSEGRLCHLSGRPEGSRRQHRHG